MKNKIIQTAIKLIAGIAVAGAAYAIGAGIIPVSFNLLDKYTDDAVAAPAQTPTVEARLISTHTVEYVEEKVIEKEYVDVVKQVRTGFRNFSTLDELENWVNNRAIYYFNREALTVDCDDFAAEMQQEALEDGYIMSFDIISISEYNELFSVSLPASQSLHAINLAIIGNSVYYIEPQTGEIVHAAFVD